MISSNTVIFPPFQLHTIYIYIYITSPPKSYISSRDHFQNQNISEKKKTNSSCVGQAYPYANVFPEWLAQWKNDTARKNWIARFHDYGGEVISVLATIQAFLFTIYDHSNPSTGLYRRCVTLTISYHQRLTRKYRVKSDYTRMHYIAGRRRIYELALFWHRK